MKKNRRESKDRDRQRERNNNVQRYRQQRLMSKAELARKAGLSALTIDRVENGKSCRMDTKRKIILALGLKLEDAEKVFGPTREDS
ncbi:MAG: helix-turn-helix domain-containing protein [Deltaproteobacteria bacterium]|nr:helix-turn-helix domain-containing protein [Deltaproteobacteria bacterium]